MATNTDDIFDELLTLGPNDRAQLAERLLESLEPPDETLRRLWAEEAERRVDAFDKKELSAVPAAQVFANLRLKLTKTR